MKKMTNEKEILKDLLLNDSEVKKQLADLVKRSKNIFRIQQNGKIIFQNFKKLKNPARICVLLIGKKFAKMLDLDVSDSMTINEISSELGILTTTLSKPMGTLVKNGFVLKDDGNYEIGYNRIPEIFEKFFNEN